MTTINKIGDCSFVRGGTSTTIKNGVITTLANNEPAFEAGGIRAWGQVTNTLARGFNSFLSARVLKYSESGYPYPISDSFEWDGTSTSGYIRFGLGSGGAVLGDMNLSVFIRLDRGTSVVLAVAKNDGSGYWFKKLVDMDVGDSDFKSEKLTEGLYRVSANITDSSAWSIGGGLEVSIQPSLGGVQAGEKVYLGGWQITSGHGVKPYIPTTTTPVTSPKETCTIPTPAELSGSAWSIAATVTPRAMVPGYSGSIIASNPVDGFDIYIDSTGALFCEAGGVTSSIAAGFANNVAKRFVVTKSGNNYTINVAGVSGSFVGGALSVDTLTYIGSDANGSWQLNGNISNLKIYPRALSATEIQAELNA